MAEAAFVCGKSFREIGEMSLEQVGLLMEAKEAEIARQGLLDLDVAMAAMAACWGKSRFAEEIRKELIGKTK